MRLANEVHGKFPGMKIEGGPYQPPATTQMIINVIFYLQCGLIGTYLLAEFVLTSPPAILRQLLDNKLALIIVVVVLNSISGSLMKTGAFEVDYNGSAIWSKVKTDEFPPAGHVLSALADLVMAPK